MSIKILIDSASDISQEEANIMGISVIPLIVTFGEVNYYDGINLSPRQFYEKLVEDNIFPKTTQITPLRYEEAYENLTKDGDTLLVLTISSKLSGTYQSAVIASEKFNGKVYVVDTLSAAIGERLLCEYALRLIKEEKDIKYIVAKLNKIKYDINIIALVNTLEYLKKGGRISNTIAFAGELFSIKPVLSVIEGEVKMVGKAIGSKKANNLLNKLVENKGGIDFNMPFGVLWSGFDDTTLKKYIKDSSNLWVEHVTNIPQHILGCTIGTYVGPGAVGVAFFGKNRKD